MKMLREQFLQTLTCISVLIYSTFSLHITTTTTNNRDSYRRPILDNIHRNLNTNTNRYISSSSSVSGDSRSSSSNSNIEDGSRSNNNIDIINDSGIIFDDGNDNINLVPQSSIQQQQQQQQQQQYNHHHPQQQMYQYHHQQLQHRPSIEVPFVPFERQQQQQHRRIEYDGGVGGGGGGDGDGGGGGVIIDAGLISDGGHFNLIPDYRRHHSSILNSINSNINSDDGDLIEIDGINSVQSMHSSHHHNIPMNQLSSSLSSSSSFPSPPYISSVPTVFSSQLSPFSRPMTMVNAPHPPQQPPHQLMMTNHHRPLLASYLLHNNHNNNNDNENINNGRPRNHHHINIDTGSSSSSSSGGGGIRVGIGGGISNINKNQNLNPTNNYDDNAKINDNGLDSIEDDRIDNVGAGSGDDSDIGIIRDYRNNKGVDTNNNNNNAETPKSLEELFGNKNDKSDNLHHHHVKNNENENIIRQSTLDIRLEQQKQQQNNHQEEEQQQQNSQQSHSNKRSGSGMIPPQVTHSQLLLRSARGQRQYDVPQIECPPAMDGMERFACPTPDRQGRYRCIDDHVLCDGFIDCPEGEDEDRQACMFYKTTKAHLDVLADALLRWARGR